MLDFLGLDRDEAIGKLKQEGLSWVEVITEPPNRKPDKGYYKVVKQEFKEGTYKLTVSMVPDNFR